MEERIYRLPDDYDLEHAQRQPDIDFYIALARRWRPKRILELGCGTGRVTLPLAEAAVEFCEINRGVGPHTGHALSRGEKSGPDSINNRANPLGERKSADVARLNALRAHYRSVQRSLSSAHDRGSIARMENGV
jgi:SAM-dependent methyltransferase